MNVLPELKYTKTHEWVQFINDTTVRMGLTDFAQQSLGSLVFVNLPEEGDSVEAGESLGDVESVKAVSDVLAPVTGTVSAVNEELLDAPEMINEDPYAAWMVEINEVEATEDLLSAADYEAMCNEEEA